MCHCQELLQVRIPSLKLCALLSDLLTFCYKEVEASVNIEHVCPPLQMHLFFSPLEQTFTKLHGIGFTVTYPGSHERKHVCETKHLFNYDVEATMN